MTVRRRVASRQDTFDVAQNEGLVRSHADDGQVGSAQVDIAPGSMVRFPFAVSRATSNRVVVNDNWTECADRCRCKRVLLGGEFTALPLCRCLRFPVFKSDRRGIGSLLILRRCWSFARPPARKTNGELVFSVCAGPRLTGFGAARRFRNEGSPDGVGSQSGAGNR
jgi:hypothetical protein